MELKLKNSTKTFLIDDEDYYKIAQHNTRFNLNMSGYAILYSKITQNTISVACVIMGRLRQNQDGLTVDHISQDKLDNRKCNLRIITYEENCRNKTKYKTTNKYRGVLHRSDINKWRVSLRIKGKLHDGGCHLTEREAVIAYNNLALKMLGDKAQLNEVPEC